MVDGLFIVLAIAVFNNDMFALQILHFDLFDLDNRAL